MGKINDMSIKEGDRVRFPFAGTTIEGECISIQKIETTVSSRTLVRCKGSDGTIYPVDARMITKL